MSSRRRTSLPLSNDAGFTLAEVLAALVLLSTIALFLAAGFTTGGRSLRRVADGARRNAELLELDSVVRSYAQRILTPYWLRGPRFEQAPGALTISYLDGSEQASLRIFFRSGTLTVGDGINNVRFDGVEDAQMEIAPARERGAPVLRLTVHLGGPQPLIILAALGGKPFPLVQAP
jgi:prepilin-type N-terminal cleavage/methylation domain-containing protein